MFHVTIDIDEERLENCLISAVEGGSTYWCSRLRAYDANASLVPGKDIYACLWEGGFWNVQEIEPCGVKRASVNRDSLESALRVLATKYPKHFDDIIRENDDAWTGDALLQCAVFGDILYG